VAAFRAPIISVTRGFSSGVDPYQTLGVKRDASEGDIKKAYKKAALSTHPDRNPDLELEQAQNRFAAVGNAYEILSDPATRQEYDLTGQVGGGGLGRHPSQAQHEQMVQEFLRRQQQFRRRPPPLIFPQAEMDAWIRADVAAIHRASRASGISTEYDERRAKLAGKLGVIAKVDPSDQSVKIRVMVSPGRADEVRQRLRLPLPLRLPLSPRLLLPLLPRVCSA
jgi:curved DNA-binding protein CbpA